MFSDEQLRQESLNYIDELCSTKTKKVCEFAHYFFDQRVKNENLRVAIVGAAGVGKSTLTNTILGMTSKSPDRAKTCDAGECTGTGNSPFDEKAKKGFTTELAQSVRLIDLPGCGTLRWKRETYVKDFDLDSMDAVMIVTSGRFSQCDAEIYSSFVADGSRPIMVILNLKNRIDEDPDDDENGMLPPEVVLEKMYRAKNRTYHDMAMQLKPGTYMSKDILFAVDACFKKREHFEMPILKQYMVTEFGKIQQAKLRRLLMHEFQDQEARAWNQVYIISLMNAGLSGATSQIWEMSHIPVTFLQMLLVFQIASCYDVAIEMSAALAYVLAERATVAGIDTASDFLGLVPGYGNLVKGSVSGGITFALGKAAISMATVNPKHLSQAQLLDPVWRQRLNKFSDQIEWMRREVLFAMETGGSYGNFATQVTTRFGGLLESERTGGSVPTTEL